MSDYFEIKKKICKNCKWYGYKNTAINAKLNNTRHNYGTCSCKKMEYNYEPEEDGLCVDDDFAANVEIYVGENFGCIHWEV